MNSILTIIGTVLLLASLEKLIIAVLIFFGFFVIVRERESKIFVLFGEIVGIIDTPGFHFLWPFLGWKALIINIFGTTHTRSMRLDQEYLRSIPVNSEEGTPMGIGVWYEMYISDPVAHIFKNVDPQGSLTAHVKNDTIKSLSNLPLARMLSDRHEMSRVVREEVSKESSEWGYKLGSVYIRKVHFRDTKMIQQIEEKVVNQLRQVTSAIEQDGLNQVNIIASKAEQEASVELAKAAAVRPKIVGDTLSRIAEDTEVLSSLFTILESQNVIQGANELTLVDGKEPNDVLTSLLVTKDTT
jgi:regulator of protease activity HflC (stomatin/prohibitin superfamily)